MKYKARLVAGDHRQLKDPAVSLHSPTMSASSTLTITAIAASENRVVTVADIGGAYLNAFMTEEVLMTLSQFLSFRLVKLRPKYKKFLSKNGTLTVKLLKALYGCVQSVKLWFETI